MIIDALLYDGSSSKEHHVEIEFTPNRRVLIPSHNIDIALDDIRIESRLGNTMRVLNFPNGVRCKSSDNNQIDQVLKEFGLSKSKAYKIESSWKLTVISVFVTVGFVWFMLTAGASYTAKGIASVLPKNTLEDVSELTMNQLEDNYLKHTKLSDEKREMIQNYFDRLTKNEEQYRLHFRSSPQIGPNAFALPSGDIVLTDQLVDLSRDEKFRDIIGVLAHEKGHVVHRHSLRMAIKTGIAGVLIGYITGDVSVIATAVPTILINSSYSREFEHEADVYAVSALQDMNISTQYIANLFETLAKESEDVDDNSTLTGILASHPLTSDRIKFFKSYAEVKK